MKIKKIFAALLALFLFAAFLPTAAAETDPQKIANGIIEWKKSQLGSETLISSALIENAATASADWYVIGASKLGIDESFDLYLSAASEKISGDTTEKATEWQRRTISILAAGGDPENVSGKNTVELGTFGNENPGKQGVNGWIWALIALDSGDFSVPEGTRDEIIGNITSAMLPTGGFALTGSIADPDITAMALTALAPYKDTVGEVIEKSLTVLSEMQTEDGDFASYGVRNSGSTAQVIIALASLGLDPLSEPDFIKNGNTLLDGILRYRTPDGGISHSDGKTPNSLASEQTLCAMAAIIKRAENDRAVYDFRAPLSDGMKARISSLEIAVAAGDSPEKLVSDYFALPKDVRRYVTNSDALFSAAKNAGIDLNKAESETEIIEDDPTANVAETFTEKDAALIPEKPKLSDKDLVAALLSKLERCNFPEKEEYKKKLEDALEKISEMQKETEEIAAFISSDSHSVFELKKVNEMIDRCNELSVETEELEVIKANLNAKLRGMIISALLAVAAAVIVLRFIKRRKKKSQ